MIFIFIMSLAEARRDERLRVKDVAGGWGLKRKILSLGIDPGDEVRVVTEFSERGPFILENITKGTKIAIGRGIARKIIVERIE